MLWAGQQSHGDVRTGLLSDASEHLFPILDGIPRLFPGAAAEFRHRIASEISAPCDAPAASGSVTSQDRKTVTSFGFQWNRERAPRTEEDLRYRVLDKCGVNESFFKDKLVLDAGCGAGLQSGFMARHGATVVALDLSDAVLAAAENNRDLPSVHVIQGDISRSPLRDETFDFVYSEGVLHHTRDPRASFAALVRLLRHGGEIAAGFYGRRERGVTPYLLLRLPLRSVLRRLPRSVVWALTSLSVPLNFVPGLNVLLRKTVLLHDPRNPGARATWCLNYDFYGPHAYQHYLTPSDIESVWRAPSNGLEPYVEGAGAFRRARRR